MSLSTKSPSPETFQSRLPVIAGQSEASPNALQPVSYTFDIINAHHDELSDAAKLVSEISTEQVVVDAVAFMNEKEDTYTLEHSYRVAMAFVVVGSRLGLSDDELRTGAVASMCHDVGRAEDEIREIVNSPWKFKDLPLKEQIDNRRVVDQHTAIAAKFVRSSAWKSIWKEGVAQISEGHHWYGSREYGVQPSEQYEYLTATVALIDELDALASERSYKAALPAEVTIPILLDQFDAGRYQAELFDAAFAHETIS